MQHNIRILIVEDEQIPANFLKDLLEDHGYHVIAICDKGADAITVARETKPDVIFMDIMLKDNISGSEAALKISTFLDTRIIFLTAYTDQEMIDYAIESQASNYLVKPYKDKQILAALQIALSKGFKEEEKHYITINAHFGYDLEGRMLYHNNQEVYLGTKDAKLFHYLVLHLDTVVSIEQLSKYIYQESKDSSTIRTLVFRLKKSIGEDLIQSISGHGYKLVSQG